MPPSPISATSSSAVAANAAMRRGRLAPRTPVRRSESMETNSGRASGLFRRTSFSIDASVRRRGFQKLTQTSLTRPFFEYLAPLPTGAAVSLQGLGGGFALRAIAGEVLAQACERAMQGDLDRVRPLVEQLGDLAHLEVGAVAERNELAVALAKTGDRSPHGQPLERVRLDVLRGAHVVHLRAHGGPAAKVICDAGARDAEHPGLLRSLCGIEARAVAKRTLERAAGHILRLRPVPDPVGNVRID